MKSFIKHLVNDHEINKIQLDYDGSTILWISIHNPILNEYISFSPEEAKRLRIFLNQVRLFPNRKSISG